MSSDVLFRYLLFSSDEETNHLRSEQQQRWPQQSGDGGRALLPLPPREQRIERIDSREMIRLFALIVENNVYSRNFYLVHV